MKDVAEALRWVQLGAFVGLALVCLQLWRRQRTAAAAWVAATFGALGAVVIAGVVIGPDDTGVPDWVGKALISVLLLFPYFLHRFMAVLVHPPRWARRAALLLTVGIVAWTLLLPPFPDPEAPRTAALQAYVIGLLIQWSALSLSVSVRLWRAGRGEPGLASRRIRLLALAALGLNLALVISGSGNSRPPAGVRVLTQSMGLVSAAFFYVAFVPPRLLRTVWRRREEESLRRASVGVSAATSIESVTDALLPHVASIFGGHGAVLAGPEGTPLGAFGVEPVEAERIGHELASGGGARTEPGFMALPLRSGWLAVRATPYTPFFGREEVDRLASIGAYVDLAIERASLFRAERDARIELQRANAELEAFLYSVSHDLRSPLVSLSGYLGYLSQDFGDAVGAAGREYLGRMAANAGYMQNLIQDLLELSRVGRIQTDASQVDLPVLVEDIAAEVRRTHVGVQIEVGDLPVVTMNPVRARQLFTNLLDNAAVHGGRPDLHVRVSAGHTIDGSVEVAIADDGVGIPEGYREKVFGAFERLEGRRDGGTGIGLAICRKIVDHLGGRIWIAGSDQGADIRIELPARVVHGWKAEVTT